ncbi:MAG: YbaK/EbsC family protein [Anaerolineaceae bacterium]|nr:YbaK/EbsC family protein [Anaerolineaceae bacterium]
MHPSSERVYRALTDMGFEGEILELQESTRTAVEAAEAAGCELGQIVKSLIFKLEPAGEAVLVLVSGANRVHEKRLGRLLGGKLKRAEADFVREVTGYAIGGIPPVAHVEGIRTYLDEDLQQYEFVWAAGGTAHAIFQISVKQLVEMTNCNIVCVK